MVEVASIGGFVAAVLVAGVVLLAAVVGRPPPARIPGVVVALAASWAMAFFAAAILVAISSLQLAVTGLFLAAAELAYAAVVWFLRGGTGPDDDAGPGHGPDDPDVPVGRQVPDEYWRLWEEQLKGRKLGPSPIASAVSPGRLRSHARRERLCRALVSYPMNSALCCERRWLLS